MERSRRARPMLDGFDVVGLAIVGALAGWVGLVAGDGAGRPGPVLWLLAGVVVAFTVGRALAAHPGSVSSGVASGIAGAAAITWPGVLASGGEPTGYANANATLTSLGVMAALGAASTSTRTVEQRGWLTLAAALCLATFLTGSVAGSASLVLALLLVAIARLASRPGFAVVGGAVLLVVALALTTAIALGGDPLGLGERSELRGELWMAAADLVEEAPLRGIGPGEFAARHPVSADEDLRWAHHGYLQVAAELGLVGLVLVLAVGGWLGLRMWRVRGAGTATDLGAAALLIVALHATVDWVWHVPAVLIIVAMLLAATSSVRGRTSWAGQVR